MLALSTNQHLYFVKQNEIFHYSRGKTPTILVVFTSFSYEIPGCSEKKIVYMTFLFKRTNSHMTLVQWALISTCGFKHAPAICRI